MPLSHSLTLALLVALGTTTHAGASTDMAAARDQPARPRISTGASTDAPAIHELASAPRVDADLSDWQALPAFAIPADGAPGEVAGWAQLGYDSAFVYLALRVVDDTLAFPERSWRYGDGFYFTVLAPGTGTHSRAHVSFGFSRIGDRLERVVVNRSGEYFPRVELSDVAFAVSPSTATLPAPAGDGVHAWSGQVVYEAAIPWRLLFPAQPLLIDSLAVNLVLVDRDGTSARRISMLEPDRAYDTELTPYRRGRALPLARRTQSSPAFAVGPMSRRAQTNDALILPYAVRGAYPAAARLRIEITQEQACIGSWEEDVASGSGLRRGRALVRLDPGARTGPALVRATLNGTLREDSIFLFAAPELARLGEELAALESDVAMAARIRLAVPAARVRLAWLEADRDIAAVNVPTDRAQLWWTELREMTRALRAGSTDFLAAREPLRIAHRSHIDGTLQPYSIQLPPDFAAQQARRNTTTPATAIAPTPPPVLVLLHGSGVDETSTIRSWGAAAAARGWMVIAPQARGLSDWYVGASESDVLEVIDHALELLGFGRARVFLAGFSMGGYGTYRLALRHPERFRAAIVMAGAVTPPDFVTGEPIAELLRATQAQRRTTPPLLILHGARDQAVPVAQARSLVQQFASLDRAHDYREFEHAGHGDPAWQTVALTWLEQQARTR